jgi:solute:Na+ symporter, SSS family
MLRTLLVVFFFLALKSCLYCQELQAHLRWVNLPSIPDKIGFAGSFAGVSNGALIVAGGANFPENAGPWSDKPKTWYDDIFVLEAPGKQWKKAGKLPHPLGYGVSLTWRDGIIFIGGSNKDRHYSDCFILTYSSGTIKTEELPALPFSLANSCGAIVNDVVYVAGGLTSPSSSKTENIFLALDLKEAASSRKWKVLPGWPGPPRMFAVAGSQENSFFLFSGVDITGSLKDTAALAKRIFLKDAYRYTPGKGWVKLADLPHATAAAPNPAFASGQNHLLIFGGDEGTHAMLQFQLKHKHPGFGADILAYHTITNTWTSMGKIPKLLNRDHDTNPNASDWPPVTLPLVLWKNTIVLPGGEIRPGVRTTRVLSATPQQTEGAFQLSDWIVVTLYFLLVIGISIYVSRKQKATTNDFFLGGQNIPWWAAGLSIFGAKLSALTFIAIPAKAYATDWVYVMNNVMIVAVAPIIAIFYLPYFRKLKITSVYEYLQIRFSPGVKLVGSITFIVFQIARLGVVIYLPALVLSTVTGIDIFLCIFLTTLITTAYSVSGGIEAVVWTEVMQVFVLLGGALASFIFIMANTSGGLSGFLSEAYHHNKFKVADLGWSFSEPVLWVVVVGAFLTQLVTYSSDQVVVQRYLTTATEKEARRSIYTNALVVIPSTIIFFGVGTGLWFFFRHHPGDMNPYGRTDDVFPWFISQQLPAGLSGLVIAGLFAATMSTISSSMNSMATVITTDIYKHFKKNVSDQKSLRFAKLTTIFLGLVGSFIAVYLVYLENASIYDQYLKIIGLFGGCLAGMFLAGIFFSRIHATGIMVGFFISTVLLYVVQQYTSISFFLYPAVAVLGCTLFGYLFSLLLPKNDKAKSITELKAV